MVSIRSWAGPTGQPGLHVAESCAASTGATEPTNPAECVGAAAGGVAVVTGRVVAGVGGGAAVDGVVDGVDGTTTAVTWEWVWRVAIRDVLEHAASSPLQ